MASPFRFALIGVGRWGHTYLRTLARVPEAGQVTLLCTSRPDNAALVPHPVVVTADWREAVRSAACDAVIIATPSVTHAQIVEACVAARKPCLAEKPLCLDLATAMRLHEFVTVSGVPVLVDHIHLFDPRYQALRKALLDGGEPIRALVSEGMGLGPFRSDTPALWDWGPHDVSMCVDLLGAGLQQVTALAGPDGPDGQPGLIAIRAEGPGGAVAWMHVGNLSSSKRRTLTVWTDRHVYRLDAVAPGPAAMAEVAWVGRAAPPAGELAWRDLLAGSARSPLETLLLYFIDGVRGGDRRYFGTALALEVTRVLAACEQALHQRGGCSVDV
ncbi:MAG: Gfo/Idh/MocA family oxidoreductase [Candidatus Omnitrophota bacterium]|nr:Gfo/Idh/MocA family oxidoreductase [Candidatus Omnitrophota bacterium]